MNVVDLHRRACHAFGDRVHAVSDSQWGDPSPCGEWNVRDLVGHVVAEDLWAPPLLAGRTIEEIGDRFDGDVLADDPRRAWDGAVEAATAAVAEPGAMERTVHLSFGDTTGEDYAWQLFADHLIHSWDLARAIGDDEALDPELVAACTTWFEGVEDVYRSAGAIGDRPEVPDDADAQTRLLAMFGREM